MSALRGMLLAGALASGACSQLPEIAADECGNGVLEDGEDCDGFAVDGLACRAPGESGQCHLDCSAQPDGSRTACPSGYGCDADHVCLKATGVYRALPERILGNAWSLATADFDGDGRADVLSQERPAFLGLGKIRVHYFDRNAAPTRTWASNDPLATPTLLTLDDRQRASVAHTRFGSVGVLTGQPDGSLISEALPSYVLEDTQLRVMAVSDEAIGDSASLVVFAERNGEPGLYRESTTSSVIEKVVPLSFRPEDLAADPLVARLFEDPERFPCRQVVLAQAGAAELSVYAMCERSAETGKINWREEPGVVTLRLEPAARITSGLLAADLDGDSHLDLIVGSDEGTYVAFGDGEGLGPLAATPLRTAGDDANLPMPLAAGDLSGDGRADLVLPTALALAEPGDEPRTLVYSAGWGHVGAPFTEAVIADFNRDDQLDAVAVSNHAVDINFYSGTKSSRINPFTIATNRPIAHLTVGDFDADQINDLAFVQLAASTTTDEEVSIAFGNLAGAPDAPRSVARLSGVQQIDAFHRDEEIEVSYLSLVFAQDGGEASGLAFMLGNTDRNLPCVLELSTFSENGGLSTAQSLGVTVGAFENEGVHDLLTLTLERVESDELTYGTWLLPGIGSGRTNSVRLGWDFPADLQTVLDPDSDPKLAAAMAVGDLDHDGLDELVVAAPDGTGTRCLVSSARIDLDGFARVRVKAPIVLEDACREDTQLAVVDLDADGARDVVILIGAVDGTRKLMALWGDGTDELDASRLTRLAPKGLDPSAFALLAQADGPMSIAYVTADAVGFLRPQGDGRRFEDTGSLAPLAHGTGIAAADVDGDGVQDLAVADEGAVRVLRAELESP